MNIPVFVINLTRSVERRNHTIKQLNDLGVPFQIIEAVDGAELSDREILHYHNSDIWKCGLRSRYLLKEEIGCALSHLKVYRKMVDEGIEAACILEDDNDYQKEFKHFLFDESLNIIEWDLFYLGHHPPCSEKGVQSKKKKELMAGKYNIGEPVEVPYGSYAYIIKKETAEKLLGQAYPIRMPLDVYIGNLVALGSRTVLLSPPCVKQHTIFNSTIYHNTENIVYTIPFFAFLRKYVRKLYTWFPFLLPVRKSIYANTHAVAPILRKAGLFENSYARFN
jgi:glycosyl transferase, family 25